MTRTRVDRKAIARSSGTWSDWAFRCAANETSTTTIRPATSSEGGERGGRTGSSSSRWGGSRRSSGARLEDHQDEDRDEQREAQVVQRERGAVGDGARAARRSAGRPRRRGARRARGHGGAACRPARRARRTRPRARSRRRSSRRRSRSPPRRRARGRSREPRASRLRRAARSSGRAGAGARPRSAASRRIASQWRTPATIAPAEEQERARRWTSSSQSYFVTRGSLVGGPAYTRAHGRPRAAPAPPDRDDRRGQLDARPPGGARAGREQGRRGARHGRLLRLPLRRARRRARPARDARDERRGDDAPSEDAAGRGDHRDGGGRARAGDDPVAGAPRSAVQAVPEPARGGVRVDPRRADPRAREARGRAERPHARAARVLRGRRDRAAARDRRPGGAVDRAREALLAGAAAGRGARGAREDLRGGLGVALPRGVARGDREDDDGRGRRRPAPRSCSRTGRSRGRRGAPASTPCGRRCAGSAGRSASSSPTATRRSPTRSARCSRRSRTTRRSRSSTGAR